jgi:poly-gamma-glutamate synthesis protein (capsule biosynthesis protein)
MITGKFLLAAASALVITAAVQAQSPPPTRALPAAEQSNGGVPALAGGDLNAQGSRDPVYRTDLDLSRATVADGFTFAAGGDLLGPKDPISQLGNPDVDRMLKLFQDADVGFANHEGSGFDLPGPAGTTHAAQNGGGYPRLTVALDRDFRAIGIKMVSLANNHAGDWGPGGLLATLATLRTVGIVEAGAGASLSEARHAGVVYTPRGTVGLIATASTFNPATVAADGIGALPPRPGISALQVRPVVELSDEQMVLMRRLGNMWWEPRSGVRDAADAITVGGATFRPGSSDKIAYIVVESDRKAILSSITDAKRTNDMVVFSIHAHQVATRDVAGRDLRREGTSQSPGGSASVADFLPTLFHQAIDAGADIVVRSGPHILGGVEIYKGKPIFYGLSSLFINFSFAHLPQAELDGAVAVTTFKGGRPDVVRIYPITSIRQNPAFGGSKIATGEDAQRIIGAIQAESEPFGTQIMIENGVGIIRIRH